MKIFNSKKKTVDKDIAKIFIESLIDNIIADMLKNRRGYDYINLDPFGVQKAEPYLNSLGFGLIDEGNNNYKVVPGIVKGH